MSLSKVGEKALLVVSKSDSMPPPEKPPQKVLDEETYAKDLEKIIVRDFYPDLPKFKVQQEYLAALEKNDTETIRRLHHKYGPKSLGLHRGPPTLSTPSTFESPIGKTPADAKQTPATFETPVADPKQTPQAPGSSTSQPGPTRNPEPHEVKPTRGDADLSLDKYLAKNTSEDNASFGEIIKEAEKKHRANHAWLFEKEAEQSEEQDKYLALPSIEKQAITSGNPTKLDTWTYVPKNQLMYVPEGAQLSAQEKIDLEGKKPREIIHTNTRFKATPFNMEKSKASIQEAANTQAVIKTGKIGVDGKEVLPTETPKVNGYSFISDPSPAPGVGVDESPMMRWGEIEGTPFRFDAADTPVVHNRSAAGPQFRIPAVPKRDQIGMRLAEKASKAHRDKKEQALKQAAATFAVASPAFGKAPKTDRLQNMSPAAQLLASSKLGIRTNTDKALRASYSPSPGSSIRRDRTPLFGLKTPTPSSSSSSSSRKKRPMSGMVRTPGSTPDLGLHSGTSKQSGDTSSSATAAAADMSSLTDNLLNLPKKRPRADDFF